MLSHKKQPRMTESLPPVTGKLARDLQQKDLLLPVSSGVRNRLPIHQSLDDIRRLSRCVQWLTRHYPNLVPLTDSRQELNALCWRFLREQALKLASPFDENMSISQSAYCKQTFGSAAAVSANESASAKLAPSLQFQNWLATHFSDEVTKTFTDLGLEAPLTLQFRDRPKAVVEEVGAVQRASNHHHQTQTPPNRTRNRNHRN